MNIVFRNMPGHAIEFPFVIVRPDGKGHLRFWGKCKDRTHAEKMIAEEVKDGVIVELDEDDRQILANKGI